MRKGSFMSWLSQLYSPSAQRPQESSNEPQGKQDPVAYVKPPKAPDGWTRQVHPDGTPYFVHEAAQIATPDNIVVEETLDGVTRAIKEVVRDTLERRDIWEAASDNIERRKVRCPKLLRGIEGDTSSFNTSDLSPLPPNSRLLPPDCELWISLHERPAIQEKYPRRFAHHFMDHTNYSLFYVPRDLKKPVQRRLNHPYWESFSKRPMHRSIPSSVEDELLSALAHYASEGIMGRVQTTSPFSVKQCEQLISLHQTFKNETSEIRGVRAWFVSIVMHKIWESRATYNFGFFGAEVRVEPVQMEKTLGRYIVDLCLLVLCFGAHERYRMRLGLAHTNGGVHVKTLHKVIAGSVQEWTDSNLLATVFVSANMAFLAVPNIQGTQKTFAIVSTLFSMASIIGGVHHLWKHRPKSDAESEETPNYLHRAIENPSRITLTSVFLCMPLVFLLWAVISFAIALLHFAFRTNRGVPLVFLASIAGVIILVTFCVRVFFYRIWEEPDEDSAVRRVGRALRVAWVRGRKGFREESKGGREALRQMMESVTSRIYRVFYVSREEPKQDLP